MNKKYYYDILVSAWVNVELMGESTRLVCVQLQERDFEKKIFIKSCVDFLNIKYLRKNEKGQKKICEGHTKDQIEKNNFL